MSVSGEFAFHAGGLRESWEHLEPHARTCARYLAPESQDVHHVAIEYQEFGDERHRASLEGGMYAAKALANQLAGHAVRGTVEVA